ncbi:hypothetical protein XELAEV_18026030mg [Xenopus laevis]|uniref:Zinc finger CCHC domain-containing protein n=1 Tax=Xenopus laevis TaxID=8355 RepID=A0A974D1Q7_XENLA|nr:hypothetical protein XELAEV_18026030mg [Xenopus laevis]
MTSTSPRPGGSVEPASVLQALAFGPSLEESLHCSSDSNKFGSVGEGVGRPAQVELSGGHYVAVEVEAGEMEAQAPAKQTAEKKTAGGRKSEPSETRRSGRNTQRQKKVSELTPGAAEEETLTLRSGAVTTKSPLPKSRKHQRSASLGASPSSVTVRAEAKLDAKGTCHGEPQGGGVSAHELQLPSSPVNISSGSQISQTGGDEYVVPETPLEDCAAGKSPAGKGEAILSQTVRSGAAAAEVSQAGESNAEDPAGNETPEPNSQLNPLPAQLTAATRGNQGSSAVAAGNVMPDTDNEAEDSEGEQKSQVSSDLSATYEPTSQRRMGAPTDVNPQLPSHKDIAPILQQLSEAYKQKGRKEAEIVAQQKLIRAAYKRNKGRLELDLITLKGELFETEVSIEKLLIKEVTEQEKKKQQMEEFNIIQEDFPPLSPVAQPTKSPQAQVSQEDPVAPIEVSSNHSAASGMSGVVHLDAVGMNDGAADAVFVGANAGTSGNFWQRRRFFRRQNCVKLVWEGKKEEAPSRTYIIKTLLARSANFKARDMEACIVQSPTEWNVTCKIPQGLDAFWRLFDTLKNQPGWKNVDSIPVSRPETKTVTIIVKNEGVPVNDVALWLQRQCTLLSPLARIYEDDVKFKIDDNIPQHLLTTFFIGKEKCVRLLWEDRPHKKVFKIIMCNLCGNIGHAHRLCPKAWHNNNTQREDVMEQEESATD